MFKHHEQIEIPGSKQDFIEYIKQNIPEYAVIRRQAYWNPRFEYYLSNDMIKLYRVQNIGRYPTLYPSILILSFIKSNQSTILNITIQRRSANIGFIIGIWIISLLLWFLILMPALLNGSTASVWIAIVLTGFLFLIPAMMWLLLKQDVAGQSMRSAFEPILQAYREQQSAQP